MKELASRVPGGNADNYIAVLCDFLASEYKWSLHDIAGMDSTQIDMYVTQALRRRAHTRPETEPNVEVTGSVAKEKSQHGMTREEANRKAMELAKQLGKVFFALTEREQALRIGCVLVQRELEVCLRGVSVV